MQLVDKGIYGTCLGVQNISAPLVISRKLSTTDSSFVGLFHTSRLL